MAKAFCRVPTVPAEPARKRMFRALCRIGDWVGARPAAHDVRVAIAVFGVSAGLCARAWPGMACDESLIARSAWGRGGKNQVQHSSRTLLFEQSDKYACLAVTQ